MNLLKKLFSILCAASLCSILGAGTSLATEKNISSISIKINAANLQGSYTDDLNINYGSDSGGDVNVYTGSDRYYITEVVFSEGRRKIELGDEVKLRITLESSGDNTFRSSYSSSTIMVEGGKYLSSTKRNGALVVNVKMHAIKGTYSVPENVEWGESLGTAKWDEPSGGSGYYELVLYRGGNQVARVEEYRGNSYNFYSYMTQKGNYRFKIRSIAPSKGSKSKGKSSSWVNSEEFYLDQENIYKGKGAGPGSDGNSQSFPVGWVKDGSTWYYRYPDGSYKKSGWEQIGGIWYLFDGSGRMLTGWQQWDGAYYYLNASGAMFMGWLKDNNKWYYLYTESPQGKMLAGSWLHFGDGKYYYLSANGAMCEGWTQIGNKWYYFYPGRGEMAYNTTIDTFYLGNDGAWVR